jgi:hypothetical protein
MTPWKKFIHFRRTLKFNRSVCFTELYIINMHTERNPTMEVMPVPFLLYIRSNSLVTRFHSFIMKTFEGLFHRLCKIHGSNNTYYTKIVFSIHYLPGQRCLKLKMGRKINIKGHYTSIRESTGTLSEEYMKDLNVHNDIPYTGQPTMHECSQTFKQLQFLQRHMFMCPSAKISIYITCS